MSVLAPLDEVDWKEIFTRPCSPDILESIRHHSENIQLILAMGCESQATLPREVQERSVEHENMGTDADQSSGTRACDNVAPIRRDANAMVEELVRGRNRKQTVLRFISDI